MSLAPPWLGLTGQGTNNRGGAIGMTDQATNGAAVNGEPWLIRHVAAVVATGVTAAIGILLFCSIVIADRDSARVKRNAGDVTQQVAKVNLAKNRADARTAARDFGTKLATAIGAATAGLLALGRLQLSAQENRRATAAHERATAADERAAAHGSSLREARGTLLHQRPPLPLLIISEASRRTSSF